MKWTIAMTQEELNRKTIIEQAIERRIPQREGAERIGVSERHFRRILRRYRTRGDEGLVSEHRGKPSNNRLGEQTRKEVGEFVCDPIFEGFGPTLLNEKLAEYKGIMIRKHASDHDRGRETPCQGQEGQSTSSTTGAALSKRGAGADRWFVSFLAGRART